MKHLLFFLLASTSSALGQNGEFTKYTNGLMYSEETMGRLKVIVDSLNVRFLGCDLAHPYYSLYQGNATWIELTSAEARIDVRNNISLDAFVKKYPEAIKRQQVWVTKQYYTGYQDERMISYEGLPTRNKRPQIHAKRKVETDKISGWVIDQYDKDALYLHSLTITELPFEYARLVQYVDCMIDTNATVMLPEAKREGYELIPGTKTKEFLTWAEHYPGKPKSPTEKTSKNLNRDSVVHAYHQARQRWDSLRLRHVDRKMKTDHYYKSLLADATQESITGHEPNATLEFYVNRYGSKADALALMRTRKVVGYCSMDSSPRKHAMKICVAAAETAQWDIFLRSHLNIMNDRFERAIDASYAQAGRKTYLQELEDLNIPAIDLLLGTSLRVSNVSENHYWAAINRTGRALADARDKDAVETKMMAMIRNEKLDLYNRLLIAYAFDHYANNLEKSSRKENALQQLETTVKTMPQEIREVWKHDKRR